jgi:poly-gamma-glutamate system protein
MKKIYWRPQGIPLFGFILLAVFAVAGMVSVEHFRADCRKPYYLKQLEAANLALKAMTAIKQERLKLGPPIDPKVDPAHSGLIGSFMTPVTSDYGDLLAKQQSINPNFAALVVDLLQRAGVRPGDRVSVSMTGSFPAMNIMVYAALTAMKLKPTIISSAAASQWGANNPNFLWIDMEHLLYEEGIFPFHSVAASFGGEHDTGPESEAGREDILKAIKKNGLQQITATPRRVNINERMSLYFQHGRPRAYINVGGAVVAIGSRSLWGAYLKPGLLPPKVPPAKLGYFLLYQFLRQGIPVINLEDIGKLAKNYGLQAPVDTVPAVGEGGIYSERRYNLWLAGGVLFGILLGLYIFSRTVFGFRMLQITTHRAASGPPEPMA